MGARNSSFLEILEIDSTGGLGLYGGGGGGCAGRSP